MTMLSRFTVQAQEKAALQTPLNQHATLAELMVRLLLYGIAKPDKR